MQTRFGKNPDYAAMLP